MPFGPLELILIVFLVLLLFGASRLPKMGRGLGEGLRGFKRELSDGLDEDEDAETRRDREAVPRAYERGLSDGLDAGEDAEDRRDREAAPRAYERQ
jgi:sec-independent protein translocase protein TatA